MLHSRLLHELLLKATMVMWVSRSMLVLAVAVSPTGARGADEVINPFPRAVIQTKAGNAWDFDTGPGGWRAERDATPAASSGAWRLQVQSPDPILSSPRLDLDGQLTVHLRMRTTASGPAQIFWIAADQPGATEARSTRFDTEADGAWHDYVVTLPFEGRCRQLRFDPATTAGEVEIDSLRLEVRTLHPLELTAIALRDRQAEVTLRNHGRQPLSATVNATPVDVPALSVVRSAVALPAPAQACERVTIEVAAPELPPVRRSAWRINPGINPRWLTLQSGETMLEVSPDGQGARISRSGRLVAHLAPIAAPADGMANWGTRLQGEAIVGATPAGDTFTLTLVDGTLHYALRAASGDWTGPVVRAVGGLEQGLLAGVEHLGKGEASSSTVDLHGSEHLRFRPDRRHLTQPLLAFVTDAGSVALTWSDMSLQPVYATPNFFDGTADHRLALEGRNIAATLRIGPAFADGERLETAVRWLLHQRGGLPELPAAPRTAEQQDQLSLAGLTRSGLRSSDGRWYHAILTGQKSLPEQPQPFGDMASSLFRLTGEVPQGPLAPGGAHISNDAGLFLTGQAQVWRDRIAGAAREAVRTQEADGSWRYAGRFQAGHFENTSSGYCGQRAVQLLEHAKYAGDAASLAAGLKALEFAKRFRTPRGASVWECPLHAPDLLASAHLTRAYTLAFELTGQSEYRELAVRWALSGIPYVYLWADKPVMLYATTGTLCATHYEAPVWIGRPVQWMGLVYADALLDLAPHDQTVDWRRLAEGILRSAEQMQYTNGPAIGLLPDSWLIAPQQPQPYDINPCAMISLRRRLQGQPAGVEFAVNGAHRIAAPFRISFDGNAAVIEGRAGLKYQVLLDGKTVDVASQGVDRISLQNP